MVKKNAVTASNSIIHWGMFPGMYGKPSRSLCLVASIVNFAKFQLCKMSSSGAIKTRNWPISRSSVTGCVGSWSQIAGTDTWYAVGIPHAEIQVVWIIWKFVADVKAAQHFYEVDPQIIQRYLILLHYGSSSQVFSWNHIV